MTTTTLATKHSIIRAKERANLNKKQAENNISRALERGKGADCFSSWERSYLEAGTKNNCTALAYNNFCYIVEENGRCVTLFSLPSWFGKKKNFDGKEKIRDPKKYSRYNTYAIYAN